jgi:YfiH family protein
MIRRQHNGIVFYQFESLARHRDIIHAVFTRIGGTSSGPFHSLNVGGSVGDDPAAVHANHSAILQVLGIQAGQVVTPHQVHGVRVATVDSAQGGTVVPATDGLISQARGIVLLLRFADCLPLMLYDPLRQVVALAHAGWRGCLAGIVTNTVSEMQRAFACDPRGMLAGLGPAIGPCCYEVGHEVAAGVDEAFGSGHGLLSIQPGGSIHFDLPGAVHSQLLRTGVRRIEASGLCTCCETDEFFSHRGESGNTGRFAAVLGLRD